MLVHTVTFRQARQFVPALIPLVAATGFGGGTTTVVAARRRRHAAVAGHRGAVLVAVQLRRRARRRSSSPGACCPARCAPCPTTASAASRWRRRCCTGCSGWCGCASTPRPARSAATDEELVVDGVPRAEGDRLRDRRPHPPGRRRRPSRGRRRRAAGAGRGGVRPLRQPLAALRPAGRQLPRRARWRPSARCSGWPTSCRERFRPDLDGLDLSGGRAAASPPSAPRCVLLALGSVIGAAVVNWGFRLVRRGGSLIAVRGLLTRRHTELEIDRIRGCTVSEGLGMRWVRAARMNALVTGLGDAARRGQLLPLGPRAEAWALVRRLVDDPGPLVPHPPAARRRRIVRAPAAGCWSPRAGVVAHGRGRLVVGAGRRDRADRPRRPARPGPVRLARPRRRAALVHRAQRVAGPRAGGAAAPGGRRLAGAAVVLPAPGRAGHRRRLRRRGHAAVTRPIDMAAGEVAPFTAAASEPWAGDLQRGLIRLPTRPRPGRRGGRGARAASRPIAAST